MTPKQQTLLTAAKFLTLYESNHQMVPTKSPFMYRVIAACVMRDIELKQEIPFLKRLAEKYVPIQSMLADVIWSSRISRNREFYCPELHSLIGRLTTKTKQ